ncbi:hypothetical protein ACFL7M_08565 [Thermodesulfobacteriota bacterium]
MISINETLILQIIHFLILVFILNRLMFRPILGIINERARHIEDTKKDLVNIEEETKELVDRCILMEKDARKDARDETSRLKRDAFAITEKIFNDTKEEITLMREKANEEIDEQLEKAKQALHSEAEALSGEITVRVIGRRIAN